MNFTKTLVLGAALTLAGAPAFAQSATTLGGGGNTRANGGVETGTTGRSEAPAMRAGSQGAMSGEVGSRAGSAAKGNDPTGTNGATNNRY